MKTKRVISPEFLAEDPIKTTGTIKDAIKGHCKSRKVFICLLGVICGAIGWGISIYLCCKYPASQSSVVSLFSPIISFLAGIISLTLSASTFMQFTATNAANLNVTNATNDVKDIEEYVTGSLADEKRSKPDFKN